MTFILNYNMYDIFLVTIACIISLVIYKLFSKDSKVTNIWNRHVFITGCDSGFGRALAKQLDKLGCPVYAGCLTENGAKSLQEETSTKLRTLLIDVTSEDSVRCAYEYVKSNLPADGVLWGVVNNAGIIGPMGPVEFIKRAEYEKVMQVNFFGQVDVIFNFMPLLKKSKGRIVNICSIIAKVPMPGIPPYIASKYAVLGYSEALRIEKKRWGIKVSVILPSAYNTNLINIDTIHKERLNTWDQELSDDLKVEYGEDFNELEFEKMKKFHPLGTNDNITDVINDIEHALFSTKPKDLYYVGITAKVMYLIELLPFGLIEKIHVLISQAPKMFRK